jgi:hypothetical protein
MSINISLINLIDRVQEGHEKGSFRIDFNDKSKKSLEYDEGDLTKSYTKFVTDVLKGTLGPVNPKTIKAFGPSLKTDVKKFKPSYLQKKSSIKEVLPSIFVHTSMDSPSMKLKIMFIAESLEAFPKFPDEKNK